LRKLSCLDATQTPVGGYSAYYDTIGLLLLRNSPCLLQRNEFETHSFGFCTKFNLLALLKVLCLFGLEMAKMSINYLFLIHSFKLAARLGKLKQLNQDTLRGERRSAANAKNTSSKGVLLASDRRAHQTPLRASRPQVGLPQPYGRAPPDGAWLTDPKTEALPPNRLTSTCTRYNAVVSPLSVRQIASADFPTRWGKFRILGFQGESSDSKEDAVALVMGDLRSPAPLVRIHSQCLTGDVFGSLRCDCRQQLEMALSMIASEGTGVLIYEQQEGRGIGLMGKLQAYELQDSGLDTVEANERLGFKADQREFLLPSEILRSLGLPCVRLLSNNPEKVAALERSGITVTERVPCEVAPSAHAQDYLRSKKEKLGHLFS
jgi:GTP cyclohydrolase II